MKNDDTNPVEGLVDLVERSARHLHSLPSRSDPRDIASELHRLNSLGRDTSARLLNPFLDPSDFVNVQFAYADSTNGLES